MGGVPIGETKQKYYFKLLKYIFDGTYHLEHLSTCNCGSKDLEVLSIHERFTLPFGTLICRACGLIQLSPRLSDADLPSFYEEIYWGLVLGENNDELSTGGRDMARKIYDYAHKYLSQKNKTLSIIEIGCGSGVKLSEIKRLFERDGIQCTVAGCDYAENAVILAKTKNIRSFQGGIESLAGEKADLVILSHVVEYFTNIRVEFDKIKKLLNTGALVYIEVPGVCDLDNKREYNYNYLIYSVLAHMYNFNLLSLRSVIEPLGFKFIAGDEFVRSIFCYNPAYKSVLDVSHNYAETIRVIQKAEAKRISNDMRVSLKARHFVGKTVKKLLKIG